MGPGPEAAALSATAPQSRDLETSEEGGDIPLLLSVGGFAKHAQGGKDFLISLELRVFPASLAERRKKEGMPGQETLRHGL